MIDLTTGLAEQEKKDRAADKRYRKAYGMTLDEVEALSRSQNDACAICERPFGDKRGNVDHAHRIANADIEVKQLGKEYYEARSPYGIAYGITKSQAKDKLRQYLKRKSVRGLLCYVCNRLVLPRLERVGSYKEYAIKLMQIVRYLQKYDSNHPLVNE